jgi:AcrR family transcriptional regulator
MRRRLGEGRQLRSLRTGIYAHYASKEDLFLALMEHRVSATFRAACKKIEEEPDLKERRGIFKRWLVEQICGPESGTLTLEFKLYAVRRPEIRDKMLNLYNALFMGTDGDLLVPRITHNIG